MKGVRFVIIFLLIALISIIAINLYKYYSWERIDIINVATLSTSVIAIIALLINAKQYFINKNKRLHELGEFRIEKIYTPKIRRIEKFKINILVNNQVNNKGRGFQVNPNNLHIVQHHLIEYLMKTYQSDIPLDLIYSPETTERVDQIYIEFLNVLKSFHDGIKNFSPWVSNYHRQYLEIIDQVRCDKEMSKAQKESFISGILLNDLLGYNMIINEKEKKNFKIVTLIAYSPNLKVTTIGYLDFLKSILPSKETYLESLGDFMEVFDKDLPS